MLSDWISQDNQAQEGIMNRSRFASFGFFVGVGVGAVLLAGGAAQAARISSAGCVCPLLFAWFC